MPHLNITLRLAAAALIVPLAAGCADAASKGAASAYNHRNGAFCKRAMRGPDIQKTERAQDLTRILLRRGEILAARGEDDRALAAFNAALKIDRRLGHAERAEIWIRKGEKDRAFWDYVAEVCWNGNYVKGLIGLGVITQRARNLSEAVFFFSEALEKDPALTDARLKRANAYLAQGASQSAITDYDAVLAADPDNQDARDGRYLASHIDTTDLKDLGRTN